MPPRSALGAASLALVLLAACSDPPADAPDAATDKPATDVSVADAPVADAPTPDAPATRAAAWWRREVIYLAMPDRFANGDAANDARGVADCLDPRDPQKYHGGDYAGLRAHLDHLRDLGATTLWITPAFRQSAGPAGRCPYHGYWADFADPDDGALDPRMGTAEELAGLAEDLHGRGMHLVLDMVVNHAGDHARVATQHPGWFHDPATCATLGSAAVFCPYRAGVWDFAQERPEVARYLASLSAGWARRFAIDGVRMDTAKYVPPGFFRDTWAPAVRAERPLFLVAEVFDESPAALAPYLDAGFDAAFNFPLRRALLDAFARGGSVDAVANVLRDEQALFGRDRALMAVNMLDNHDVPRFVNEPGPGVAEDEIRRRYALALAVLFTAPGIPQLYAGDELGAYGGNDPDNRRDMPAWAFSAAGRGGAHPGAALPDAQATYAYVQRLARVRREHAALTEGAYVEMWRQNGGANVLAYLRSDGDDRVVVAVNNGAAASGRVAIRVRDSGALPAADRAALADGAVLEDMLAAGAPATLTVVDGTLPVALPARTAGIYRLR